MQLVHIADALRDYAAAKDDVKYHRGELVRIAVELGMSQDEAIKTDLVAFLDGYLFGQGMKQSWRKE